MFFDVVAGRVVREAGREKIGGRNRRAAGGERKAKNVREIGNFYYRFVSILRHRDRCSIHRVLMRFATENVVTARHFKRHQTTERNSRKSNERVFRDNIRELRGEQMFRDIFNVMHNIKTDSIVFH